MSLPMMPDLTGLSEVESSPSPSEADSDFAGIDVSTLFAGVELPESEPLTEAATSASLLREAGSAQGAPDLTHAAMLRDALAISGVRITRTRKRTRGKCTFDAVTLHQLATNPSLVHRTAGLKRVHHRAGFQEFRRWYVTLSGEVWRTAEPSAAKHWAALTSQEKYHWFVLREAIRQCGNSELKQAPPSRLRKVSLSSLTTVAEPEQNGGESAEEEVLPAVGLLLTYFPHIGQDDPDVGVWVRQGFRGAELREKLVTKMAYRCYFDAFVAFLKKLRDEYGFSSLCACMELGEDSRAAARVHLHAYVGFLQKDGGIGSMRTVRVPRMALVFCGCKPFVVATRGHKGRRMHETVGRGFYYVIGPKSTCMLRYTDLEPIKDSITQ